MRIESKATLEELGLMDKAFVARKFALTTFVDLAGLEDVTIVTREGDCYGITEPDNYYCAIGNNGDVWPVEKSFFDQNYERSERDYRKMWHILRKAVDYGVTNNYEGSLDNFLTLIDLIEADPVAYERIVGKM